MDASGNRVARSRIAFTGADVVEEATAMSVAPSRIVFNNMLQSATIIPSVQFQFRGLTPLPGSGTGVTYTSSHPDMVGITPSGQVYPLAETAGQDVTIRVSYPGVQDVVIPVTVDLTKRLVGLELNGVIVGESFVLPRLNAPISLPAILGVFDDGTRAEVSTQLKMTYSLPDSANGILSTDSKGSLTASSIIPDSVPIPLTVSLVADSSVAGAFNIAAVVNPEV